MGNLDENPQEWLEKLFECEYCDECYGDAMHHTAVPFMGNWFGRCDFPPDDETGELNAVIKQYHILAHNFDVFDQ